jgi:hypothetical protein
MYKSKKDWEDFIEIVFFSLVSYAIYGFYVGLQGQDFISFQALFDEARRVPASRHSQKRSPRRSKSPPPPMRASPMSRGWRPASKISTACWAACTRAT